MKINPRTILLGLLLTISLTACGMLAEPTVDANQASTQAAQTVEAILTERATATQPSLEPSATQPPVEVVATATATSLPPTETPAPTNTPEATQTSEACDNQATFVDDVTIPDNTILGPGETFIKTWRLKNTGTCTWKTSYALFFVSGELMGANSPTTLSAEVKPGQEADLSVQFKAPGKTGTYRSDWTLLDTNGARIGLKDKPEATFWVQIVVQEGTASLNLGNPTWKDNMDTSAYWYVVKTDNVEWEFEKGLLRMKVKDAGTYEEWGLSNLAEMDNYFLQATFKTGNECAGLDRYGVLVRAPDKDQGYVFEFSCNGRYRLYIWADDKYSAIQEWQDSSLILTGAEQTNVLGIWLKDKTIRLYANSKLLAEFENDKFSKGRIGLVVGAAETDNLIINVDEVAYWTIGD